MLHTIFRANLLRQLSGSKGNEALNADSENQSQQQLSSLLECFQNGQFNDAEKLAVSITNEFPKHQFGWKVLGAVLKQTGRVIDSFTACLLYTSPSPRDRTRSRMPSSA